MKYWGGKDVATAVDATLALPFPVAHEPDDFGASSLPDEVAWSRAATGGDRVAFGRLVERHKSSVFGLCYRLLGGPQGSSEEARDAAQETFVRAYTAIARFDARQPFGSWVLRIARNHCIDLLRRRRPTLSLAPEAPGDDPADHGVAAEPADRFALSGEAAVQEREAQRDLELAVAGLAPRYREVIALFHLQHKSYAEIAGILQVPIGTVMTWLHRARKELRVRLAEHFS